MPTVEELLDLDLLTLSDHTALAGDRLDPAMHAQRLRESMAVARVCSVRRRGMLVAYAMLSPLANASWFVRAFNTHPDHRDAAVLRELFVQVGNIVRVEGITDLTSNVYKTNRRSMAFHRKLGFRVTRENDQGVEFFVSVRQLLANPTVRRTAARPLHPIA